MAITRETLRLVTAMRAHLDDIVDTPTRDLTKAWVRAWDTLSPDVLTAVQDLMATGGDQWPTRAQIQRSARASHALNLVRKALLKLAAQAAAQGGAAAGAAAQASAAGQGAVITSQLPPAAGAQAVAVAVGQIGAEALAAIVARTTQQITSLSRPLPEDVMAALQQALIRGVALGENPREVARLLLKRLEGEFNGGLARALNICRTEIIDAHRAAARASQDASADMLAGWIWSSALTPSTCASCWSKHGTLHPLSEPGPLDHQSGRCSRTPKTKTWKELGFDADEPADVTPDAETVFKALPRAQQLQIMGAARLDALARGDITWADLSTRRTTDGWRPSYVPTPLRALLKTGR